MGDQQHPPVGAAAPLPPSILQFLAGGGGVTCDKRPATVESGHGHWMGNTGGALHRGGKGDTNCDGDNDAAAGEQLLCGGSSPQVSEGMGSYAGSYGSNCDAHLDFGGLAAAGHLMGSIGSMGMPPHSPQFSAVLGARLPGVANRRGWAWG